jgi:hypothetical protein
MPKYVKATTKERRLAPVTGGVATARTTDSAASATALATGYKTNNAYIGQDKDHNPVKSLTELANEQGKATADAGFPQLRIFPFSQRFFHGALSQIQQKSRGNQNSHSQQAANHLEGKGTDQVHANALGNEGKAPDDSGRQQGNTALKLFFHK